MSVEHMAMVFAADSLDGGETLLLLAYTNYTDPHGYCWPSEQRLADDCGTSVSTVARQKRSLKSKGLLKSVRRINPRTGEPISNLSRINLPLLASMRRPVRSYDDDMVQQITFEGDPEEKIRRRQSPDLLKCHSDRYPLADRQVPPVNVTGTPRQNDSQSLTDPPREPVEIRKDGRSPSTSGSRGSGGGGFAASGKTNPPPLTADDKRRYEQAVAALPPVLAELVPKNAPRDLKQAVLDALDWDGPAARTPEQLVDFRLMPKWRKHYGSQDAAGEIRKPVGVLKAMLLRNAECGDARCDERTNVDSGESCRACDMRAVDRRADRDREQQASSPPEPAAGVPGPRTAPAPSAPPVRQPAVVVDPSTVPLGDYRSGAELARARMVEKALRPR
ncbi:helix-turn-helix domain-containing protein [Streptomyces sp. NPDC060001]|uniref:helix-turn-helix domain-containing protein n=1 Tax=Streptomyces sp. NPDC060001 TaxID=3347032 RepID=UPI003698D91E